MVRASFRWRILVINLSGLALQNFFTASTNVKSLTMYLRLSLITTNTIWNLLFEVFAILKHFFGKRYRPLNILNLTCIARSLNKIGHSARHSTLTNIAYMLCMPRPLGGLGRSAATGGERSEPINNYMHRQITCRIWLFRRDVHFAFQSIGGCKARRLERAQRATARAQRARGERSEPL